MQPKRDTDRMRTFKDNSIEVKTSMKTTETQTQSEKETSENETQTNFKQIGKGERKYRQCYVTC